MSLPKPETLEREKDKRYLTEAELIRRLGVPDKVFRPLLPALISKFGFPEKSVLFDRYSWKAVERWLDKHDGLLDIAHPETITRGRR